MRLQSHIWVAAFLRKEQADGEYATVIRKGSPEAGAIFIVHRRQDGLQTVHAPAPQSFFEGTDSGERKFETALQDVEETEAAQWLDKQVAFDPDCWIVECERRTGELAILNQDRGDR